MTLKTNQNAQKPSTLLRQSDVFASIRKECRVPSASVPTPANELGATVLQSIGNKFVVVQDQASEPVSSANIVATDGPILISSLQKLLDMASHHAKGDVALALNVKERALSGKNILQADISFNSHSVVPAMANYQNLEQGGAIQAIPGDDRITYTLEFPCTVQPNRPG